jgi:hypothetical protein
VLWTQYLCLLKIRMLKPPTMWWFLEMGLWEVKLETSDTSIFLYHVRTQWDGSHLQAASVPSLEPDHSGTWVLDFPPPEQTENKLLFEIPLWYFAIGSLYKLRRHAFYIVKRKKKIIMTVWWNSCDLVNRLFGFKNTQILVKSCSMICNFHFLRLQDWILEIYGKNI